MLDFPRPNKRRPVLVLTRQDMIGRLHTVTVAPITSTIRGAPSEILIGVREGLRHPSVVNLHHVATVPLGDLRNFVGSVSQEIMHAVRDAMLFSLGW
jgi:mRNA interferase MazF